MGLEAWGGGGVFLFYGWTRGRICEFEARGQRVESDIARLGGGGSRGRGFVIPFWDHG